MLLKDFIFGVAVPRAAIGSGHFETACGGKAAERT
jgi:hypothetical protein